MASSSCKQGVDLHNIVTINSNTINTLIHRVLSQSTCKDQLSMAHLPPMVPTRQCHPLVHILPHSGQDHLHLACATPILIDWAKHLCQFSLVDSTMSKPSKRSTWLYFYSHIYNICMPPREATLAPNLQCTGPWLTLTCCCALGRGPAAEVLSDNLWESILHCPHLWLDVQPPCDS